MSTTPKLGLSLLTGRWRTDGTDASHLDANAQLLDELIQTEEDVLALLFAQAFGANSNVLIQNLQAGDVLGWDDSVQKWRNYPNGSSVLQYIDGGTF